MGCFIGMQEATRCGHDVFLASVSGVFSSPPGGADAATTVEVAAELRKVNHGCSGRRAVEAEISCRRRFPGLLHARERGIDLLFGGGRECRGGW